MEKKRSRGVTIIGWGLVILGSFGFIVRIIGNTIFFGNQKLYLKVLDFYANIFKEFRTSGYPIREISEPVDLMTRTMINNNPNLVLVMWMVLPVLAFLLFLSGIGILRLRNEWRKGAMIVSSLLALFIFVEKIYSVSYVVMFIAAGKSVTYGKGAVVPEIMKTMKVMPGLLIKSLIFTVLPVCLLVYFLTRKKVRRQFK